LNKIVLIDDESGQLEIMANIILDMRPHFEVTAFDSSIKALEFIRNNDIDAVISDIRMPVMNGLELSEQIVKIKPEVVIAIISAYSDFEYAQRAIDFGVASYLIKPVSNSKITELLDKIELQITLKTENLNRIKDLNNQLESYKPVYIEKQLKYWLMGNVDSQNNDLIKSLFKWNRSGLVAASRVHICPGSDCLSFEPSQLISFFKAHIRKLCLDKASVLSILYDEQHMIFVSILDSCECISLDWALSKLTELTTDMKTEFGIEIRVGISEIADHVIDALQSCFKQALLALDYSFLITSPVCLAYSTVKKLPAIDDTDLYILENKIQDRFRSFSLSGIRDQLCMFCDTYSNGAFIASSSILREHFLHIALSAKKHAQYNANDDIVERMNSCTSILALADVLLNYLNALIEYQQKKNDSVTSDIIESIKLYINNNYKNDISLELIAENFH